MYDGKYVDLRISHSDRALHPTYTYFLPGSLDKTTQDSIQ